MKKIFCLVCAVLMIVGIGGCGNDPVSNTMSSSTPKATPITTPVPTPIPTPTQTQKPEIKTTQLYDEVFMTFSGSVGKAIFNPDLEIFQTNQYDVSITHPVDFITNVDFTDKVSGDMVSLVYVPKEGIDLLSVVQYSIGGRSIAISDESHTEKVGYSTHDENREPINMKAYGIPMLEAFMFGQSQ